MTASPDLRHLPRLHLVTDDEVLRRPDFDSLTERLLDAGGNRVAVQLRGPGLDGREIWERVDRCARAARRTGAWLFVNDRLDVALGSGAQGVQLGRSSFPVPAARRALGPGTLIGASVHSVAAARRAAVDGADLVIAGTLFETPTHPGRPATGVDWLHELRELGIPVIGIGGIGVGQVPEVLRAGAHGVAVISGVWHAKDPISALGAYLATLE